MTSGESLRSSAVPGVMSRSCVPRLLPESVLSPSLRPQLLQLIEAPLSYHGMEFSF